MPTERRENMAPVGAPPGVPTDSDLQRLEERTLGRIDKVQSDLASRLDLLAEMMRDITRLQVEVNYHESRLRGIEGREERRVETAAERDKDVDKRISHVDGKLSKWVNMGAGAWGLLVVALAVWEKLH